MYWVSLGAAALLGFSLAAVFCSRERASVVNKLGPDVASDRELALYALRRELANYMVRRDPERYLRLYHEARAADVAIGQAEKSLQEVQFAAITDKHRFFQDFDLVSTREYVLYADALMRHRWEEIEEHYLDIVRFQALQKALSKHWEMRGPATSDDDLEHLQTYVRKMKDTKFRQRLMVAADQYIAFRQGVGFGNILATGATTYETAQLAVYRIPHFHENRYGVHFKDTNEFGLYGSSYDGGRDKIHKSYYRSDPKFEAEIVLSDLRIDERI